MAEITPLSIRSGQFLCLNSAKRWPGYEPADWSTPGCWLVGFLAFSLVKLYLILCIYNIMQFALYILVYSNLMMANFSHDASPPSLPLTSSSVTLIIISIWYSHTFAFVPCMGAVPHYYCIYYIAGILHCAIKDFPGLVYLKYTSN